MGSPAEKIATDLSAFLQQAEKSAEVIQLLEEKLNRLENEVNLLKESGGDEGWMKANLAASRVGMKGPALRRRIIAKGYAEGIVWRRSDTGQVIVHLGELRKVV